MALLGAAAAAWAVVAQGGGAAAQPAGIHKIRHVVVIMQENRSFDSYFGTFPGADGIPAGVCVPDPLTRTAAGARTTTRPTATPAGRTTTSTRSATSPAGR